MGKNSTNYTYKSYSRRDHRSRNKTIELQTRLDGILEHFLRVKTPDAYQTALNELEAIIQDNSGKSHFNISLQSKCWYAKARCVAGLGRLEEASELYLKIIADNPSYISAIVSYGRCLEDMGQYQQALNWYKENSVKFPESEKLQDQYAWLVKKQLEISSTAVVQHIPTSTTVIDTQFKLENDNKFLPLTGLEPEDTADNSNKTRLHQF